MWDKSNKYIQYVFVKLSNNKVNKQDSVLRLLPVLPINPPAPPAIGASSLECFIKDSAQPARALYPSLM